MIDSTITDDLVFNFIREIFIGIEKKTFATLREKENFEEILKTRDGMFVGMNLLEVYLDQLYKKLVNKDDEFICNTFNEISGRMGMNPVISLNLIANIIMRVFPLFTRSKLKTDDEEIYLQSVKDITATMKKYILKVYNEDLNRLNVEKSKKDNEKEKDN